MPNDGKKPTKQKRLPEPLLPDLSRCYLPIPERESRRQPDGLRSYPGSLQLFANRSPRERTPRRTFCETVAPSASGDLRPAADLQDGSRDTGTIPGRAQCLPPCDRTNSPALRKTTHLHRDEISQCISGF